MKPFARWLLTSLALGLLCGAGMALRIHLNREAWLDRTALLVVLATLGGGLAAMPMVWLLPRMRARIRLWKARCVAGLGFTLLWVGAMGGIFILQNRLAQHGLSLDEDHPIKDLIVGSLQGAALYAVSAPIYLFPWLFPAIALFSAFILLPPERRG